MKVALCLSGQPRFVQEVAPYIIQNCCDGYDVDIFAHLWFDENLQTNPYKFEGQWQSQRLRSTAVDEVLKIYKPVSFHACVEIFFNAFCCGWYSYFDRLQHPQAIPSIFAYR